MNSGGACRAETSASISQVFFSGFFPHQIGAFATMLIRDGVTTRATSNALFHSALSASSADTAKEISGIVAVAIPPATLPSHPLEICLAHLIPASDDPISKDDTTPSMNHFRASQERPNASASSPAASSFPFWIFSHAHVSSYHHDIMDENIGADVLNIVPTHSDHALVRFLKADVASCPPPISHLIALFTSVDKSDSALAVFAVPDAIAQGASPIVLPIVQKTC